MLAPQRHALILEEISKVNTVSIRALSNKVGVSRETIRKDIEHLAQLNELVQIRGGAIRIQTAEPHIFSRAATNTEGKNKIAQIVADIIPDGASIIIDNGSTTQAISRALLRRHKSLTIYTNDLKITECLAPVAREITLLGGRIDPNELAVHGLEAIENLSKYRADFSIVSAGGVDASNLFTDFAHETAVLRNAMLLQAKIPIIVADKSKFGSVGQVKLKSVPLGTMIISDTQPPTPITCALKAQGLVLRWS